MENDLIEMINESLPVVFNSAMALKMVDVVENVIKTLFEPWIKIRNGKADVDVENYRQRGGVLTRYEAVRLQNFLKVAGYAGSELDDEQVQDDGTPEFDWIMRFFDAVSLISDKDIQKLWGKILAGEMKTPGVCSLRTINIIRNLSKKEALDFNEMCRYVMISGNMAFIFENGFNSLEQMEDENIYYNEESNRLIKSKNLNFIDNIQPLIESGLLTIDHYFVGEFEQYNTLSMSNAKIICMISDQNCKEPIRFEPYFLTKSGMELYRIIKQTKEFDADFEYQICCIKELRKRYDKAEYSCFFIRGADDYEEIAL